MKMGILETIQEERAAFRALPTSEKIRIRREERVASLLKVGYITPAEAEAYREEQKELPKDRKALVVLYYLRNGDATTPSMEGIERTQEVVASFHLRERGALSNGKTIGDTLTKEEANRWVDELTAIHIQEGIRRAETFVDAKRKRIRSKLLRYACIEVSLSLMDDQESRTGLDSIPYLRELLKEKGYRRRAKSLNEKDREAIQEAALHYLDLLELSFLNGVGLLRSEEYEPLQDETGGFKEDFYYRDAYDEALIEFESLYLLLEIAIADFYEDGTAKEAIDFLSRFYEEFFSKDFEGIKESKFTCFLEEGKV